MYTLLEKITSNLNAFIDDPLTLVIGREKIINHDNDLGNGKLGATYVALIQPSKTRNITQDGFVRNEHTVKLFFGALYKQSEDASSTNEFNDSGANEKKTLQETLELANEFVYKLMNDDRVKSITSSSTEAFDVKDTNHTGHYLSITFEMQENKCYGQAEVTPNPEPELLT